MTNEASPVAAALEVHRVAGGAPTLVFLHEGLGSVNAWRGFPDRVAAATGCAGLVYSRRGYGGSAPKPGPWPVTFMHEEAARDLPELLEREGVSDAVLVGHSDGASIALLAAASGTLRHVLRGVVAIAPHVFVEDVTVASIAAFRASYRDPSNPLRARLARAVRGASAAPDAVDDLVEAWTGVWLDPSFRAWDIRPALAQIAAPVLAVQGSEDAYGTLAQIEELCARVGGPATRLVLSGASHSPFRDAPDQIIGAIAEFVGGL